MSIIKKQLFEQLALIARSLGSPQRIEIIDYLAQAERSVETLSQLVELTVANTSRHLQILKQNGLVSVRKKGKNRFYKLAGDDVIKLLGSLRETAETHLAEVDRLRSQLGHNPLQQPSISSEELASKMRNHDLVILDVRPNNEFLHGHIQGAINVQPEDIKEKINSLSSDKTVVAYCRGAYCIYSYEMVETLISRGFKAMRLEEGFPEWKAAGLPFEQQPSNEPQRS